MGKAQGASGSLVTSSGLERNVNPGGWWCRQSSQSWSRQPGCRGRHFLAKGGGYLWAQTRFIVPRCFRALDKPCGQQTQRRRSEQQSSCATWRKSTPAFLIRLLVMEQIEGTRLGDRFRCEVKKSGRLEQINPKKESSEFVAALNRAHSRRGGRTRLSP